MIMQSDAQKISNRLKRIEGQLAAIRTMLENDRECDEVVIQFLAAKSAIESAFSEVLEKNLVKCLNEDDNDKMKRLIKLLAKK
jgi:DNA-binding FrmR family transcriptional regulator